MKKLILLLLLSFGFLGSVNASTMCPDGTFVGGDRCQMAADGSFVGVSGSNSGAIMCADGSFVGGDRCQMAADGSFVGVTESSNNKRGGMYYNSSNGSSYGNSNKYGGVGAAAAYQAGYLYGSSINGGGTTGVSLTSLLTASDKWKCPSGSKRDLEYGCVKGFVANLFEGEAALNKGDYETALKHLELLANNGSANAQFYIGKMYEEGISFKKNDYWAHHWINKAAQLGLPDAQYTLGYFYRNGVGVVKDSTQTVKWFNKAGKKGHPKAQFNLGAMYINGDTVSKSLKEAKYWINLAMKSNHPRAEAIWNDFELWKY
jgi:TPR repeat protein